MPKRCRRCGKRFLAVKRTWIIGSILCVPLAVLLVDNAAGSWRELSRSLLSRTLGPQLPPLEERALAVDSKGVIWSAQLEADAAEGIPEAQLELGLAHLNGAGARRDTALARQWITRAAEQGLVAAEAQLGTMYHDGRGALQNFSMAREWLERAARKGNAEAQFRLGVMHRQGQGTAEDRVGAYVWFNLAAAQGHEEAGEARDDLLALLQPEEILAAQQASQQFPTDS
jgi:TPR repeat protein